MRPPKVGARASTGPHNWNAACQDPRSRSVDASPGMTAGASQKALVRPYMRASFQGAFWALETLTRSHLVGEGCHPLKVCQQGQRPCSCHCGATRSLCRTVAAFGTHMDPSSVQPMLSDPTHRISLACAISRCHPVLAVSDSHVSRELLRVTTPPPSRSSHRIRLPWLPRFQPREIPKPVTYPARSFIELPITTLRRQRLDHTPHSTLEGCR